jgi:peptidoglycan/LPS O-acetylase OafA/YrhL
VFAYVRGEVALGRALAIFALLSAGGVVVVYPGGPPELRGVVVVAAALLAVGAAAPVGATRARVLRSRRP